MSDASADPGDQDRLHDVLIVSANRAQRVTDGAGAALLRFLAVSRMVRPTEEAIAQDWVEVYCAPDASSHEFFMRYGYDGPHPVFKEAVFRWGTEGVPMPWGGDPSDMIYWFVELRGSRFNTVLGDFLNRIRETTHIQPHVLVSDHQEPPPHREVPEGQERKDLRLKRGGGGGGLAGTRVEEF